MKKLTALALISFVALCTPVLAQDMLTGEATRTEATISVFSQDPSGNQSWVREYDGRNFGSGSIELLNSMGYNGDFQYFLDARDLFIGDEDVLLSLHSQNIFGMDFYTTGLTHRLDRIPAINPFLVGTPAAGGDDFLDLSPDANYELNRRVTSANLRTTPAPNQWYRLVGTFWQETENGTQQVLFRARAATPGVIANRQRASFASPIDRNTQQGLTGFDVKLGSDSVVNYRFVSTRFNDGGVRPTTAPLTDVFPINTFTRFNSQTTSNVVKVRSKLSGNLDFTGVHTSKSRENKTASTVLRTKTNIDATNAALSYRATDSLSFTGRYRMYELDNDTAPVINGSGLPSNAALSKEVKSFILDGVYTGLPKTYLKFGYERRDTNRDLLPVHGEHEEFEHPFVSESSESDILRASVRFYPTNRLSINGSIVQSDTSSPGYVGLPTDSTATSLNATYLINDNFAVYGDYSRLDETNNIVFVPFSQIPAQATTDAEEELRAEAAGQNYNNEYSTLNLGAWYAVNSKLVLDANYGRVKTDASSLWILGLDPNFLPHLSPAFIPYNADSKIWTVGATFSVTPKSRLYGRFMNMDSSGETVLADDWYAGISRWTPVCVKEKRYTIGYAYDLNRSNTFKLDYSLSDWEDEIDPANDGQYNLWRLAWTRDF